MATQNQITKAAASAVKTPTLTVRAKGERFAQTDIISFRVDNPKNANGLNPKVPSTNAHKLYAAYRDGMTVAQYREAVKDNPRAKAYMLALHWDVEHNFITVSY